jgi:hypothetical protein
MVSWFTFLEIQPVVDHEKHKPGGSSQVAFVKNVRLSPQPFRAKKPCQLLNRSLAPTAVWAGTISFIFWLFLDNVKRVRCGKYRGFAVLIQGYPPGLTQN